MISEIIEIMERRLTMRSKFDEQLLELNKEMIEMGNKIVQSIKNAIEALIARDEKMARAIMEGDVEIDHLQKKIEISLN